MIHYYSAGSELLTSLRLGRKQAHKPEAQAKGIELYAFSNSLRLRFRLVANDFPGIVCILDGDRYGAVDFIESNSHRDDRSSMTMASILPDTRLVVPLHGVSYDFYQQVRRAPGNRRLRIPPRIESKLGSLYRSRVKTCVTVMSGSCSSAGAR